MAKIKNKTIDFFSLWDDEGLTDLRTLIVDYYERDRRFVRQQGLISHFIHTLEVHENYLVGVIATCRKTGVFSLLDGITKNTRDPDLGNDEGYGIANAFIYDHRHNLLLYEFSQLGLYGNIFRDSLARRAAPGSNLQIESIQRADVYTDVMNMDIKDIYLVMTQPRELVVQAHLEQSAVGRTVSALEEIGPEVIEIKLKTKRGRRRPRGTLQREEARTLLNNIQAMIDIDFGHSIQKAVVRGYEREEADGTVSNPLDLVSGRLREVMRLEEPDVNSNLLIRDRIHGISDLYRNYVRTLDVRRG